MQTHVSRVVGGVEDRHGSPRELGNGCGQAGAALRPIDAGQNEKEFKKFKDDIEKERSEQVQDTWGGMQNMRGGRLLNEAAGAYEPPKLPDPYSSTSTVGLKFEGEKNLGKWAEQSDLKESEKYGIKNGGDGKLELEGTKDTTKWYGEKGNTKSSDTYAFKAKGDLGITALSNRAEGDLSWTGAQRVMRNEDGTLKNIRYTTTVEGSFRTGNEGKKGEKHSAEGRSADGHKKTVTQSVQIDFDTPEEKKVGERLLENRGTLPPKNVMKSMANPLLDSQDGGDINRKPPKGAPEWEKLFHKRGRVWQYDASGTSKEDEMKYGAKMSLQLGAGYDWATENMSTKNAQILESPKNGKRKFIDYSPCVAPQYRRGS